MCSELGEAAVACLNVLNGLSLNGQMETANTSVWTDTCPTHIQTRQVQCGIKSAVLNFFLIENRKRMLVLTLSVCLSVCMYVFMYVCMYIRTYVRMHVCMHVRMYVCTYVRMYACTYVCMYVNTYLRFSVPCIFY
jgi:hypothetical protein